MMQSETRLQRQRLQLGLPCIASLSDIALFALEQSLFALYAPAVATQAAIFADDAMARDDQRDRIVGAGLGNCADGGRLPNGGGDIAVIPRFADGNLLQLLPDFDLEGSRAQVQGQIEVGLPAFQIGDDSLRPKADAFIIAQALRIGEFRLQVGDQSIGIIAQAELADSAIGRRHQQVAQWAIDDAVEHRHAGAAPLVCRGCHAEVFVAALVQTAGRAIAGGENRVSDALALAHLCLEILDTQFVGELTRRNPGYKL